MAYTEETLLVTTIGDDRTIVLPDTVPSGSTVGIFVLSNGGKRKLNRKERFKAALAEIEAAISHSEREPIILPSAAELTALVERARKEPFST